MSHSYCTPFLYRRITILYSRSVGALFFFQTIANRLERSAIGSLRNFINSSVTSPLPVAFSQINNIYCFYLLTVPCKLISVVFHTLSNNLAISVPNSNCIFSHSLYSLLSSLTHILEILFVFFKLLFNSLPKFLVAAPNVGSEYSYFCSPHFRYE